MSVTSERIDFMLELAARRANLPAAGDPPSLLTAAEADDTTYVTWAEEPRPELGGVSPRAYAAARDLPAVMRYLDESAARRRGQAPRLWAEELLRRLNADDSSALEALMERAMAEPEGEWEVDYPTRAALQILGRWGDERAVPILLAALAAEAPAIRLAAVDALAAVGAPALSALQQSLRTAQDPQVRQALIGAISRMPRGTETAAALRQAWAESTPTDRPALVHGLGRYGDPAFIPLILEEMANAVDSRTHWALCRVALHRLGAPEEVPAPPPPQPGAEGEDLYTAAWELYDGGLNPLAADWIRQALERLADQEEANPAEVDWYLYERTHSLADQILERSPELALQRYVTYCAGALWHYGVLSLDHLISVVSLSGNIVPPAANVLWAALKLDNRFVLHTGRLVSLPGLAAVEEVLDRRQTLGLGPALITLPQMALTGRGLPYLAWTAQEEEAAHQLMELLPPDLARPERIAELQAALRGGAVADAFREWLSTAMDQGVELDDRMRKALGQLWDHTSRWELFGHTPWGAKELLELEEARAKAPEQRHRLTRKPRKRD